MRLSASVEAASLIRRAEVEGGFGAILRKGDPERGSLLLVIRNKGSVIACLERMLDFGTGGYRWEKTGPTEPDNEKDLSQFLDDRTRFDEDLWLIELDIAQPERFIAETTSLG